MSKATRVERFKIVVIPASEKHDVIVLIYALGEDGNIYECASGHWLSLAIDSESTKALPNNIMRKVTLEANNE